MSAAYGLVGALVFCGGLGWWLGRRFGWHPWGLLVGLGVGLVIGFYDLARVMLLRPPPGDR